jgi:hypothetical protein
MMDDRGDVTVFLKDLFYSMIAFRPTEGAYVRGYLTRVENISECLT